MSNNEADALFQGGGGGGAPSFKFGDARIADPNSPDYPVGKAVSGVIVSTAVQDQTEYNTNPPKPKLNARGEVMKQLQVILQTELRNWQGVTKVPTDEHGQFLPPEQDDGKRAIYVSGWMVGAVGDAVRNATGQQGAPREGGKLAVRVTELVPSSKGNPFRKFDARYQAPAAGDAMFQGAPAQQTPVQAPQAPVQAPQAAPPVQQPPAQPDPWASQSPTPDSGGWDNEPPF